MSSFAKRGKAIKTLLPEDAVSALACVSRCPMRDMLERKLSVLNDIPRKDIYCLVHDRHSMAVRNWLAKLDAAPQDTNTTASPFSDSPTPAVAAPKGCHPDEPASA